MTATSTDHLQCIPKSGIRPLVNCLVHRTPPLHANCTHRSYHIDCHIDGTSTAHCPHPNVDIANTWPVHAVEMFRMSIATSHAALVECEELKKRCVAECIWLVWPHLWLLNLAAPTTPDARHGWALVQPPPQLLSHRLFVHLTSNVHGCLFNFPCGYYHHIPRRLTYGGTCSTSMQLPLHCLARSMYVPMTLCFNILCM